MQPSMTDPTLDEKIAALRAVIHRQKGAVYHRSVGMGKEEAEEHAALESLLATLEASRPAPLPDGEPTAMQPNSARTRRIVGTEEGLPQPALSFGNGELVVDTGLYDKRPAVFIRRANQPGVVGSLAARENVPLDQLCDDEAVFTFNTTDQAENVADALVGVPTATGEDARETARDLLRRFESGEGDTPARWGPEKLADMIVSALAESEAEVARLTGMLHQARDQIADMPHPFARLRSPRATGEGEDRDWAEHIFDRCKHSRASRQDIVDDIASERAAARAQGHKDAIDKTTPGWRDLNTALRMIRDAVEELGPVGAVPSRDAGSPDYIGDANDIITGIKRLEDAARSQGEREGYARGVNDAGEAVLALSTQYDAEHKIKESMALDRADDVIRALAPEPQPGSAQDEK